MAGQHSPRSAGGNRPDVQRGKLKLKARQDKKHRIRMYGIDTEVLQEVAEAIWPSVSDRHRHV